MFEWKKRVEKCRKGYLRVTFYNLERKKGKYRIFKEGDAEPVRGFIYFQYTTPCNTWLKRFKEMREKYKKLKKDSRGCAVIEAVP